MNTDSEFKPIAPSRKTRKTKCNSSLSDARFEEKPDKNKESEDNDRHGNIVPARENGTKQDTGDVNSDAAKHDQDSSPTLPKTKNHGACMYSGDESEKNNTFPENLVEKTTFTSDIIIPSIGDSLKHLTENTSVITTEEDCNYSETMCTKSTHLETVGDLSDSQSHPIDSEHTQEEKVGNKSCDGANNTDDYPDNLNPFADSTSDPEDGSETLDPSGFGDVNNSENGPVRTTTKTRPSLYPWRPFAGETTPYKSHMIPDRQTAKKRASLYPWRPFGEQDYPEELNPFNEILQNDINDDHNDTHLNKVLEMDSQHPNVQQRFALQTPSKEKYQTSEPEITGEQDVPSNKENDDVEAGKPKKIGRGKKFLKTVRKKFRKFWDRVLRR